MNRSLRRQFLESNLDQIETFLRTPTLRRLERIGFESRRNEIVAELKTIEGPAGAANVILSFDGGPVVDGPGIDAGFAGKAIVEFQDVVSLIDASKKKNVSTTGRIPNREKSGLRLVGFVHQSFGFEFQEIDNILPFHEGTSLSDSVKSATRLIAAAGQGDDEFIDAVSDIDPRVQTKLISFLEIVKSARAVCNVTADDTKAALDVARVAAAVERVTTTTIADVDERYPGKFCGLRLDSRDFNHEINDLSDFIKGKVHDDVDRATMTIWNRKWFGKSCVAVVVRRTVSRLNKSTTTFTLKAIDPPDEPAKVEPTKS